MIIRAPFLQPGLDALLDRARAGLIGAGEVAATLSVKGVPRYSLVCQELCRLDFHEPLDGARAVVPGASLGEARSLQGALDQDVLLLWMASHAAFRGWQSQDGEGGHVANEVVGVHAEIAAGCGVLGVVDALAAVAIDSGDTLVIADKCISFACGRLFARSLLDGRDPKFLTPEHRRDFAGRVGRQIGHALSERQLLCIDFVDDDRMSISIDDHNRVCAEIAAALRRDRGVAVDVVISDSDTGVDYGYPLIGGATVGASPLGATAGLTPYEAMRVSIAAEIARGHAKGVPFVLCKAKARNAVRERVGGARPYADTFDLSREPLLHHGLKNSLYWREARHDHEDL